MKKLNYKGLNEELYYFKCDNGLPVYLKPNNLSKNFFISIGVRYGAKVTKYKKGDNKYDVTPGVAHFLEHRVLDFTKDKEAELKIRNLGSIPNACTSYYNTRYFMLGSLEIKENMRVLFDRVFSPNFKSEDIEKEKGIIVEEYYMYDVDTMSKIYDTISESVYNKYYMKVPVLGYPNNIKSITRKELERVYKDFYVPENMYIVITGNFNKDEVSDFIINYMKKIKYKKFECKVSNIKEPLTIKEPYKEVNLDVQEEKVAYILKCDASSIKKMDIQKKSGYISLILSSLFSPTSDMFERYKEEKLISTYFITSRTLEKDFFDIKIVVDTSNPNEYIENIKKDLSNIKISKEDFERKKKMLISDTILTFDDIQNANDFILFKVNAFKKPVLDFYESLKDLNYEEMLEVLKLIKQDNTCIIKFIK